MDTSRYYNFSDRWNGDRRCVCNQQRNKIVWENGANHICVHAAILMNAVWRDPEQMFFRHQDLLSIHRHIRHAPLAIEQLTILMNMGFHNPVTMDVASKIVASAKVLQLVFHAASPNLLAILCRNLAGMSIKKAIKWIHYKKEGCSLCVGAKRKSGIGTMPGHGYVAAITWAQTVPIESISGRNMNLKSTRDTAQRSIILRWQNMVPAQSTAWHF